MKTSNFYFSLTLFLVSVLIMGCAPQAQPPQSAPQKEQQVANETAPVQQAQQPAKELQPPALNPKIQELVDKAKKLKSMEFMVLEPKVEDVAYGDTYLVKAGHTKIELRRPMEIRSPTTYFDTVYLDRDNHLAVGYCENIRDCPDVNKSFSVVYELYDKKLPTTWLDEIDPSAVVKGDEQFDNRDVLRIGWEKDNETWIMLLDRTYGAPLKVEIMQPDRTLTTWRYTNFQANTLLDSDVVKAPVQS